MFEGTKRALADLHPIDPALKHNEWDLAKALQELVKDLEREISALDSRVSKLSRRLDEIER